jgi:hypothetical protein
LAFELFLQLEVSLCKDLADTVRVWCTCGAGPELEAIMDSHPPQEPSRAEEAVAVA